MNIAQAKPIPTTQPVHEHLKDTVLLGDCVQIMRSIAPGCADFVLTDPPYLVRYCDRSGRRITNDADASWLVPAFAEIFRVLRRDSFCVTFYSWSHADKFIAAWRAAGFHLGGHLTFTKPYASSERFLRYHHENAYLLTKDNPPLPAVRIPDVLAWNYSGNRLHPTQKPLGILTPIIESFSRLQDVVLDPFCGSGSTLLAAKLLGRRFLGIELDAHYCRVARDRVC